MALPAASADTAMSIVLYLARGLDFGVLILSLLKLQARRRQLNDRILKR